MKVRLTKRNIGLIVLVGLVLGGILIAVTATSKEPAEGTKEGATDVCHQFVEKKLKAPATAKFIDKGAALKPTGNWIVNGEVDAENSFGALIRSVWSCEVHHDTGPNWTSVDVQLLP